MTKLMSLNDALLDELKDLFSAENQLLKALPKMEKKASNMQLKAAIKAHTTETEGQVKRLEKIAGLLGEELTGKTCKAMQGLVEEGKEVLAEESDNPALIDALIIGAAQRVEHYEMAGYGTARAMAEALGEEEIATLLQETLDEESDADEKLSTISESEVLRDALGDDSSDEDGDEVDEDPEVVEEKPKKKPTKLSVAKKSLAFLALTTLLTQSLKASAETHKEAAKNELQAAQHAVDNTGRNSRDVNDFRKTAGDQQLSGKENKVLANIRKALVRNESLSTYAKNVKVIVEKGVVTLRGPVRSVEEKEWIAGTASKLASTHRIVDELEVSRE